MTEEIKTNEPVIEKIEAKKETNSGLTNFIWSIFFSSMAILITIGTAIYFNNKVYNLYEENLQIYGSFIETLEAVDNDPNSDLVIKFNQIYAKDKSYNNQLKEPSVLKESFMADYYQSQSNWLNTWLSALGIILAILAFIIPILFTRFLDERKAELERHCEKYEKTFDRLRGETEKLQTTMQENIESINKKKTEIDDAKMKMEEHINKTMGTMADDIEKVKKYVENAEKSENIAKSYSLYSQAAQLINNDNPSKEDYQKAIDLLSEAILLNDKNSDFYYARGIAYNECSQDEKALDDYNKAIDINPNNDDYYSNKAVSLDRLGKYELALDMHNKAVNLNPYSSRNIHNRSACYCHIKQYDDAILDAKRAYYLSKDKRNLYNLIEAYIFNGNIKEALENLELFIDNNPSKFIVKDDINLWTAELNKYPDDKNAQKILELIKNLPKN